MMSLPNNKIRCVVLGLGNQAFEHIEAAVNHPDIEIIAGIDSDKQRWHAAKQKFSQISLQYFSSLAQLKHSNLAFDAMILALPHHVYERVWEDIISFGKPLLKEKPLGRDYQEAKKFVQSAQQAQCGLQTAIQRRQHPSYQFLANYLIQHKVQVTELHAHLHLGKGQQQAMVNIDLKWRDDRNMAGGGALLDAGYHLVDLIQYLIGDFDVISATMWNGTKADNGEDIEDRCWLIGSSSYTWIMVDTWVKGEINAEGGFNKSEAVNLLTNQGKFMANRKGVWHNGELLYGTDKNWQQAMQNQLTQFAKNIRTNRWQDDVIWDQLPAMRKIEAAYWLSSRY